MAPTRAPSRGERLQFKQPLTAKGLANAELAKRLKTLHLELADLDQELVVTESLNTVAQECISHSLLLHKEKGVRAYLACCLVDILRLYAPEAPYDERELKDLFQFLFKQLKYLSNSTDAHFSEYFYLVESLSNVKSIVLICDLESSEELMSELFRQCFDLISTSSPKNVQLSIADILAQVLDEASSLPSDVVDILLAQFLSKAVSSKPAAHALAVEVCQAAADKLQRYVCQYFAEVITTEGGNDGDAMSDDDSDAPHHHKKKGVEVPSNIVTAHALIKELNRSVPHLLLNVIPQLEEELVTERPEYRKLATEVLGHMIGEKPGKGDVAIKYPGTWKEWLKRSRDKNVAVRIAMVESLPKIWLEHPELGQDIDEAMRVVLSDPDDKVRIAACGVFESLDYETASTHVGKDMLVLLADRILDRKPAVRKVAFKSLGRLYELAFPEIDGGDEHAVRHFSWIPGCVLDGLQVADPVVRNAVHATLLQYILPLPKKDDDEVQWVDRLLSVMQYLDAKQTKALLLLTQLNARRPGLMDLFIVNCEKNNGGIIDEDADAVKARLKANIQQLANSSRFNDPAKAVEDLTKFAKANEKQLYKLFKILLDPQSDLKLILKSYKDCMRRLEQISATIVDTFTVFLRSICLFNVNRSSIPTLLKRAPKPAAVALLTAISKDLPVLYKAHVAQLTNALSEGNDDSLVTAALHALSRLAKSDPEAFPDKKLAERALHYAKHGTPKQAKYAATIVALDSSRPGKIDDLVDHLAEEVPDASDAELVVSLSALNRISRFAQDNFETKSEQITTVLLEVLHRDPVPGEVMDDPEIEWVTDDQLDDLTKARVLSVKVLTNRCIAYAKTPSAEDAAVPVFQLLWPLLHAHSEDSKHAQPTASRLRLASSLSLLKLAATESFEAHIYKHFDLLAQAAQDTCFEVRCAFVDALRDHLRNQRIRAARFNLVLFLVAHDPEPEIKEAVASHVRTTYRRMPLPVRQAAWEHPFLRLIHLLAHHPDFDVEDQDVDTVAGMAKYIQFYIDNIVSGENISYLYHLALRIKTLGDAESESYNNNLYILSELSQHLLKQFAKSHNLAIPTFPENPKIPSDILRPLSSEAMAKVKRTVYLKPEVIEALPLATKTNKPPTKKRPRATNANKQPRKSPKPRATKAKRATKKKTPKWNAAASENDSDADPPSEFDSGSDVEMKEAVPVARKRGAPKDRSNLSPPNRKKSAATNDGE